MSFTVFISGNAVTHNLTPILLSSAVMHPVVSENSNELQNSHLQHT